MWFGGLRFEVWVCYLVGPTFQGAGVEDWSLIQRRVGGGGDGIGLIIKR